jgi:hypothetical protein
MGLFGVTVSAANFCDAAPSVVSIQSPPTDDGGGSYSFDATAAHGEQLTAVIHCQLDPVPAVQASDSVRFQP